jgi:hypothetical protein
VDGTEPRDRSGRRRIGASRPRSRSRSRTHLEARSSAVSGVPLLPPSPQGGIEYSPQYSWSPDGAHITASNATNSAGMVFIATVIARHSWTSEISLVGHENTVEVAVRPLLLVYRPFFCSQLVLGI